MTPMVWSLARRHGLEPRTSRLPDLKRILMYRAWLRPAARLRGTASSPARVRSGDREKGIEVQAWTTSPILSRPVPATAKNERGFRLSLSSAKTDDEIGTEPMKTFLSYLHLLASAAHGATARSDLHLHWSPFQFMQAGVASGLPVTPAAPTLWCRSHYPRPCRPAPPRASSRCGQSDLSKRD